MKNKRVLIPAILTATMAAGGLVGGSLAFFQKTIDTEITITTANIVVSSEILLNSLKTYSLGIEQAPGTFENEGSTATLTADGLVLTNVAPGDKATFDIKITNSSSIGIRYEVTTILTLDEVEVPDAQNPFVVTGAATGKMAVSETEKIINVGVELPMTFETASYMGKQFKLLVRVLAVQENAHIPDTSKGYADSFEEEIDNVVYDVNILSNAQHFESMLNELAAVDGTNATEVAAAQKTIYRIASDIDMTGKDINKGVLYGTLDGNGHKIENVEFNDPDAPAAGIFAEYYDGATVKNLTIDNVNITGGTNVGALFGETYYHAHGITNNPGTELVVENVTIGSNVSINGTKGVGGIAGSARYIESLTLRNVVNNADVSAETYNAAGFFGTLTSVKNFTAINCVNNGNIRAPHEVAGFVGQSPALTNITITNCENHGRITDFSKNGSEAKAGWFVADKSANAELKYTGNVNDGKIYYVTLNENILSVFEDSLIGTSESAGIRVASGTAADYKVKDDTVVLTYEIVNNQFVITQVSSAVRYNISMQVWARDVRLEGNTATVYKEKFMTVSKSYTSVEDLHDNFGRITRAGYFLDSTYTNYDYDPTGGISYTSTIYGRPNFFRLPYAQKATYAAKYEFDVPSYDEDLNEWVFLFDSETGCETGLGHIMSPKNTTVAYIITAYDANNHAVAGAVHKDVDADIGGDGTGSFLMNMNGDKFLTHTGSETYPDVA